MGQWAECLSQIRNFAKARFSEIQRRDRTIIFIARIALLLKSAESTVAIEPNNAVQYQDFHLILILYNTIGSLLDHCFCGRQSGFAFPVHIAQVNAVCQNAARKAGVRRCTGCAGWLRHHQHYAFDGPCSGCSGRLDNADDVSEIMQRSPVGSRFAVSFC